MEAKKESLDFVKDTSSNLASGMSFINATTAPLFNGNVSITEETATTPVIQDKKIAETTLKMRQDVLESIYSIATSSGTTQIDLYNKIVLNIAQLLNVPFVSIVKKINTDKIRIITRFNSGICDSKECKEKNCYQCSTVLNSKKPLISNGELPKSDINCDCFKDILVKTYLGVPIVSSSSECTGTICIADTLPRLFTNQQLHIVEIFSRYVANEFDRESIQKELIQSQEMKLLGVLTSGVAHEVRNPLNAIWAITEALFQEINSDSRLNIYKDHIKSQVERLSLLMQELLDLGKPFSCKDADLISLPLICKKTVDFWSQTDITKRTVHFINSSPDKNGLIKGDPQKIRQVIVNLLDNASQHSSSASTITVRFYQSNSTCHVDVIDKGCGISKEIKAKVFDPFFTTRVKGTGLGLPIVKNILDIHDGLIELNNNEPPPGITAALYFPAAAPNDQVTNYPEIPESLITTDSDIYPKNCT
jgi:signal transduction histidine kinase